MTVKCNDCKCNSLHFYMISSLFTEELCLFTPLLNMVIRSRDLNHSEVMCDILEHSINRDQLISREIFTFFQFRDNALVKLKKNFQKNILR